MRPIWSGTISFGLINIPIKLYTAVQERGLDLDMLRKDDLCPIKYTRVCRSTGEEVPYNQIVRGYEYEEGDYVVLEKEDLQKVNARKTNTIDIMKFVKEREIDTKLYAKPYYLEPAKGAGKAYVLLREALAASQKVAVCKFVFRTKEDLGIIRADGETLILNQLRYVNELRSADKLNLPDDVHTSKPEIEMAVRLIDQLTGTFKPDEFKNTYTKDLEKLIEQKAHGKTPRAKGHIPEPTAESDLMSQLKASLIHSQAEVHHAVH